MSDDEHYFFGIPWSYVFTFLAGACVGILPVDLSAAWAVGPSAVMCVVVAVLERKWRHICERRAAK